MPTVVNSPGAVQTFENAFFCPITVNVVEANQSFSDTVDVIMDLPTNVSTHVVINTQSLLLLVS